MRLRLPSPAMVVAVAALVVASTGSAIAAKHYMVSSTRQISPTVLKQLHGANGRAGATGPEGAMGPQGPAGAAGSNGSDGSNGADLTSHTPLPSGQSESGLFGDAGTGASGTTLLATVTYPQPLDAGIAPDHVVEGTTASTHCSGPGHADPGFLCVYRTSTATVSFAVSIDTELRVAGAGRLGVALGYSTTGANGYVYGSYTVTAP
jgi:hypothetical protein